MAINPVNSVGIYSAIMNNSLNNGSVPQAPSSSGSSAKRDSIYISEAAKDMAAKMKGTSYQEEAQESASVEMTEKLEGLDN